MDQFERLDPPRRRPIDRDTVQVLNDDRNLDVVRLPGLLLDYAATDYPGAAFVPLQRIEVIKGEWRDGEARETVLDVSPQGGLDDKVCLTWTDGDFDSSAPAFWYVRVEQEPTLRWSAVMCRQEGRCDDYPEADRHIHERAWSSPIWYLPVDP